MHRTEAPSLASPSTTSSGHHGPIKFVPSGFLGRRKWFHHSFFPLPSELFDFIKELTSVKKRRAQICGQIQRFLKIPTELRRQTRTSTTHAKHNLIKLKQYRVKRIVSPSTPTCWRQASSFRSRRNTISHGETQTQQTHERTKPTKREEEEDDVFPVSVCLMSSYVTQQLLFIKWTSDTSPSSRCLNW